MLLLVLDFNLGIDCKTLRPLHHSCIPIKIFKSNCDGPRCQYGPLPAHEVEKARLRFSLVQVILLVCRVTSSTSSKHLVPSQFSL